jgi:hypothetical protein
MLGVILQRHTGKGSFVFWNVLCVMINGPAEPNCCTVHEPEPAAPLA